jgi:hypothetical protein
MAPGAGGRPGFLSAASDETAAGTCLGSSGNLEVIMTEVLIPARQGRAARVAIMSACPQDLTPVNGAAQRPVDAHFQVHHPGADDDG